ncbi:MAG: hypothetical protein HUU10_04145 [Bacteroidetes bacterium]|nr:hypothetical protein [Bacteroidota bacterium]
MSGANTAVQRYLPIKVGDREITPKTPMVVIDATTGKELGFPIHGAFANARQHCFPIRVELRERYGECAMIEGKLVPTIPGYRRANQYAGLNVIKPQTVNAEMGTNPFVKYDTYGYVREIWGRALAIGYSPTGQLVITDVIHYINMANVLAQDILAVIKKNPKVGVIGPKDACPEKWTTEITNWENGQRQQIKVEGVKQSTMGFLPTIQFPVEMGIHFDTAHGDLIKAIEQYTNRQKHIQGMVMNIAERNALAAHPAIAAKAIKILSETKKDAVGELVVYASKTVVTDEKLKELSDKLQKGHEVAEGKIVTVETTHEVEDRADLTEDAVPDVTTEEITPEPITEPTAYPHAEPKTKKEFKANILTVLDEMAVLDRAGKTLDEMTVSEIAVLWGEVKP